MKHHGYLARRYLHQFTDDKGILFVVQNHDDILIFIAGCRENRLKKICIPSAITSNNGVAFTILSL